MPTPTYTPLANITLGANAASVTFSSINQGYRDLILVTNTKVTVTDIEMNLIFNGASANLSTVRMIGNSSGASSGTFSNPYPLVGITGQGTTTVQIMDYSATDKHKTMLIRYDFGTLGWTAALASRYANTSAITSISLSPFTNQLAAGFRADLYGIVA